jgi:hypothetical protein
MVRILLLSMLVMLIVAGCTKTVNDTTVLQGDLQIRFSLPGDIVYDTVYRLTGDQDDIHKFNIDYYTDVDSAIYTFYSSVQNGNNGTVELYNFTDSIPIAGSLINVVSNEAGGFYQSTNLTAAFPHKEITLGLRLKGSVQGSYLNAVSGYLYLYRK